MIECIMGSPNLGTEKDTDAATYMGRMLQKIEVHVQATTTALTRK